jgi:adenylosuccinate lyase
MESSFLSPLDERYFEQTKELRNYFSEMAFFSYRLFVEVKYFINLIDVLPELEPLIKDKEFINETLMNYYHFFTIDDYKTIKEYEKQTNHDVKALEYYIADKFKNNGLDKYIPFIHFGITSQDVNTSANILALKDGITNVLIPKLKEIIKILYTYGNEMKTNIMLSFTHGQAAVPTTMGKELMVYKYRLDEQLENLKNVKYSTKFGGAVGNFNAHKLAYPTINWNTFADNLIVNGLSLSREKMTTQISNYDNLCNILNLIKTINNIINDLNIDCWLYISKGYMVQRINKEETGSSTMPHKVNPINFENSEGNICIANALIEGVTRKLSISRLQRDLTDSTILRNMGVLFGHSLLSYKSTLTGLNKISINNELLEKELEENKAVLSEGIQTVMRKHTMENAYEILKYLTRTNEKITDETLQDFIVTLPDSIKEDLKDLSIKSYTGYSGEI